MVTLTSPEPIPAHDNIFNAPIGVRPLARKRIEELKARNLKMAYAYLILAGLLLVVYSALFFYPQARVYFAAPAQLEALKSEARHYENVILPSISKEKELHKAAYDKQFAAKEDALNTVFPKGEDKLELVKTLENFAMAINAKSPPFEFSSMTLGNPEAKDGYVVTPISTSIYASKTNFDRFLQLINLSGRLELDSDVMIRLMSVGNISIRYRGANPQTGEDQGVDFSVKLNAYSRS
ncbi:hypothetical protein JXA05_03770 [Candidatus Peregrinibacteria bacterium]|nr:hypothetical protein [Candidatus Peregrinibacteria bacterium]